MHSIKIIRIFNELITQIYNMENKIKELNKEGKTDMEISILLNIPYFKVGRVRNKLNLPVNSKHQNVYMTDIQEEAFIGTLLGDSTLVFKTKLSKYPSFQFSHTEKQKEYFNYKVNIFKNLMSKSKIHLLKSKFTSEEGVLVYGSYSYNIPSLLKYKKIFYPINKKVIPLEFIKNKFSELSLALLIYDDGCKDNLNYKLSTYCFERENVLEFSKFLYEKFNIKSTVHKNSVLYFSRQSTKIITKILQKYPVKNMQYKIIV